MRYQLLEVGCIALCLLTILFSIAQQKKMGLFHPEAQTYLNNYLNIDHNFLYKIYNLPGSGFGQLSDSGYRARELSHIFNFLDSQFILFSYSINLPHLLSITHYLCLLATLGLWILLTRKWLKAEHRFIGILFLLLFLTSPAPFFSGFYFRTGKILTSLFILLGFYLTLLFRDEILSKKQTSLNVILTILLSFCWGCCIGLFDEIGMATLGIFALLLLFRLSQHHHWIYLQIGLLFSLLFLILYKVKLGPFLVAYWGTDKSSLVALTPPQPSLQLDLNWQTYFHLSPLFLDYLSLLMGNFNPLITSLFCLLIMSLTILTTFINPLPNIIKQPIPILNSLAISFFIVSIAMVLILRIMEVQHPPLLWSDVQRIYYSLPFTLVFTLGLFALTCHLLKMMTLNPWIIVGVVGLLILFNVNEIPNHYQIISNGHLKDRRNLINFRTEKKFIERNFPKFSSKESFLYLINGKRQSNERQYFLKPPPSFQKEGGF